MRISTAPVPRSASLDINASAIIDLPAPDGPSMATTPEDSSAANSSRCRSTSGARTIPITPGFFCPTMPGPA